MSKPTRRILAIGLVSLLVLAALAWQYLLPHPEPAVTLAGKTYSVETSTVGELLDFADARALLERHLPGLAGIRQLAVARPLGLRDIQPFHPELITDDALAALDAELRGLKGSGIVVYTTGSTQVGVLLDDPEARAIVDRHLPGFSTNAQIDQARGFTLRFIQKFDPQTVNDTVLTGIDSELEQLARTRAGQ